MAYVIVTTKRARDWWEKAMMEADNGYLPTVWLQRDGRRRSWRIQSNNLGEHAITAIHNRAPQYARLPCYD